MKVVYKGILALIRSAITKEKVPMPAGFSLEEACAVIKAQQVENLVYCGAMLYDEWKETPVMRELFQRNCFFLHQDIRQRQALERMFAAFEENGIDYMPVKGCNLKQLYPQPAMRIMCDADVLIRMEQYEKIKKLLLELGYTEGIVSGHELHWHNAALHLELHKWLIHPDHQELFRYLTDYWNYAHVQSGHCYALTPEDEWIYTFIHYAKHYRMGGIGIRQVVDLWLYQKKYRLDMDYIREELKKIQLLEFFENTQRMIEMWFSDGPEDPRTEFMTEYIFSDGSWATEESFDVAYAGLRASSAGSVKVGRRMQLLNAIFPDLETMQNRYTALKRMPWLLPVFWGVRWADALLFRRENIHRTKKRLQNATDKKVEEFTNALRYVGLEQDV